MSNPQFEFMSRLFSRRSTGETGIAWVIDRSADRVWATVGTHRITFAPGSGDPPYSRAEWVPLDDVEFTE